MKQAHVVTTWIGTGVPPDDKWRADIPGPHGPMSVLGNQYVDLARDCPKPNVVVVRIQESRAKHEGYIDGLKTKLGLLVLETWEDDGQPKQEATALRLKNFLVKQGMGEDQAELIAKTPEGRTEALLAALDDFDKRARRRIELERYS